MTWPDGTVCQDGPTQILICCADCSELEQAVRESENSWDWRVLQEKTQREIRVIIWFWWHRQWKRQNLVWNHELIFMLHPVWIAWTVLWHLVWYLEKFCLTQFDNLNCFLLHLVWYLCSTRVQGPVLETSGEATERDGWPLQPHTDVSATRLRGGLDTTSQVTSK